MGKIANPPSRNKQSDHRYSESNDQKYDIFWYVHIVSEIVHFFLLKIFVEINRSSFKISKSFKTKRNKLIINHEKILIKKVLKKFPHFQKYPLFQ